MCGRGRLRYLVGAGTLGLSVSCLCSCIYTDIGDARDEVKPTPPKSSSSKKRKRFSFIFRVSEMLTIAQQVSRLPNPESSPFQAWK